ncbi:MAG: hypothetical protein JWO32_550 [Bacteroidetes bacterium]|nr:hypothetical protein [Bacteroidota bacterium]
MNSILFPLHQTPSANTTSKIFKRTLLGVLILMSVCSMQAQKYKPKEKYFIGGGLESFSSGNCHGTFFSPYLNITKGRKSFSGGPVIQNRSMEINGGKVSYSYNLSGGKKREMDEDELDEVYDPNYKSILQLNMFGFMQYMENSLLSKSASQTEQKTAIETHINWDKARLSTAEAGVGFELYVKLSKRVSWKSYVAGSVYYHVNYIQGMYHERMSSVLVLGTGVHICPL